MKESVLIWFRRDLRLDDHPAWSTALASGLRPIPVYIEEPWRLNPNPWLPDYAPLGPRRSQFLQESLFNLQEELGGLLVRMGNPALVLEQLAKEWNAVQVHCTAGHAPWEQRDEKAVAERIPLFAFESSTLLHPDDLPFSMEDTPQIFTQFRKQVERNWAVRPVVNRVSHFVEVPSEVLPIASQLPVDERSVLHFKGGRKAALARLQHYFDKTNSLSKYKETRNGLLGPDYSSKFSPWLACGSISPREVYASVREYEEKFGANESTYWLIFELLWRDYFAFVARQFGNRLYSGAGLRGDSPPPAWTPRAQGAFLQWRKGETGQPFVDACMHELNTTGFLSNRGRQVAASFLVHDLGVDWRAGAAWFEHHLIDHDPASNAGNWLYIAGRGNDPRPFRRFNPEGQAERYDPQGRFQAAWAQA
jgi:deoxyribodipyrimidine photo-lyase